MFDFIRTHQRLAQALLLVLILPAFVFFGISGYDQMFGHGDAVASVEGEPVPRAYFDNTYRQQVQQMQQMLGDNFDAAVYDSPAMRAEVLENIITQQAMLVDARKNRITVARPEIQRAILQRHQDLRTDKGQFDIEAYQRLLAANQMTAAQYEASISQQLALGAVERAVRESAMVPQAVVDSLVATLENRRVVRTCTARGEQERRGVRPEHAREGVCGLRAWSCRLGGRCARLAVAGSRGARRWLASCTMHAETVYFPGRINEGQGGFEGGRAARDGARGLR